MKLNSIANFLRTIVATVLTVVTISACEPVSNSDEEQADIISIVGAKVVQVDAAGGDVELSYKLSDAPEGAALTLEFDCDWIESAAENSEEDAKTSALAETGSSPDAENVISSAGILKVRVNVKENDSASSRTGKVFFKLKGAKTVSLSVLQRANPDYIVNNQMSFSLDVTEITESTVKFTVAPNIEDSYYYYGFFPTTEFDRFPTPAEFVASTVADMKAYAEKFEEKNGFKFNLKNYLYKGYRSTTQESLVPSTDYYFLAFDLTPGWGYSGRVSTKKFRTSDVPPSSGAFVINYDQKKGIVGIQPTEFASGKFGIGIATAESLADCKSPRGLVSKFVEGMGYDLNLYNVVDGYRGLPVSQYSDIVDGTDYVAFAFLYNNSKISEIAWLEFTYIKP